MSTANKRRGEFPLPQAGPDAYLRFDLDALEKLEVEYGDDYFDAVISGFSKGSVKVIKKCLEVALVGGEKGFLSKIPHELSLHDLKEPMINALFVSHYGRDLNEQQEHEAEMLAEQMEKAGTDPRMAAALLLQNSANLDTGSDSDPKSAAA